jgi:uncharacterized protein (DUF1697 family)
VTSYLALLRGINVGGRNPVAMADLREAFEAAGHGSVRTYIQTGNVLFESDAPSASLEQEIEAVLERRFGFPLVVVVRSARQLRSVATKAPEGFGQTPELHHSDVIFLKGGLTPRQAMRVVELRDGVDRAWTGPGVLYFERLSARRTASRLNRIAATPEYKRMTIRSWATTAKLVDLVAAGGG